MGRPGFRLVECDLTRFVHVSGKVDLVAGQLTITPERTYLISVNIGLSKAAPAATAAR